MKKIVNWAGRLLVCITFAAAIVLGTVTCSLDISSDETYNGPTHFGKKLSISDEQVWERNYTVNRLSQAYTRFAGDNPVTVVVISELGDPVGFGGISKEGILDFIVTEPPNLLDWKKLKIFFEIMAEGVGWETVIDVPVNGIFILDEAFDFNEPEFNRVLMREGVSGTNSSISFETVYYIYVDRNCRITGGHRYIEPFAYTLNAFDLYLYEGWNTICMTQTYTTLGNSTFSMEAKNPNLKWVLIPFTPPTP